METRSCPGEKREDGEVEEEIGRTCANARRCFPRRLVRPKPFMSLTCTRVQSYRSLIIFCFGRVKPTHFNVLLCNVAYFENPQMANYC